MTSIRLSIRAHEISGIFLLHDQRIEYIAKIILYNICFHSIWQMDNIYRIIMHTANYQKDVRPLSKKREVNLNNLYIIHQPGHTKTLNHRYFELLLLIFRYFIHLLCYYLFTNIVSLYLVIESFDMIYYVKIHYVTIYDLTLHTRTKPQTYITNMSITGQIQPAIIYCVIRYDNYLARHLVCYRIRPKHKKYTRFLVWFRPGPTILKVLQFSQ